MKLFLALKYRHDVEMLFAAASFIFCFPLALYYKVVGALLQLKQPCHLQDTLRLFVFHMLSLDALFAFGAVSEDTEGWLHNTLPLLIRPAFGCTLGFLPRLHRPKFPARTARQLSGQALCHEGGGSWGVCERAHAWDLWHASIGQTE